jgi:predicted  nucleic acid-binding Zn-ribbon protein
MNNDISIMIELQHFWDNVIKSESEVDRCKKSIKTWEVRLKDITVKVTDTDSKVKNLKLTLKKNELDLDEIDLKIKKTEERKNQLKSEREIEAQNNEIIRLNDTKDKLEGTILDLLDNLEKLEQNLEGLKTEYTESNKQIKDDIEGLNKKIVENQSDSECFKNKFNELLLSLSPVNKSRFSKLISSKDGVAIAKLNGETCSRCNFQVPSSIAASALSQKNIETCTNCGRFIY